MHDVVFSTTIWKKHVERQCHVKRMYFVFRCAWRKRTRRWNLEHLPKFGSVALNGGVSLPQSRQRFAMSMTLWMSCPLPCTGHPADPQLEDLHLERPSAALKGVTCGTLFLGANHLGIDESSPVECFFFFFVSGFLTQEPGAEMSSEISTSKCHARFRGLTEQAWLQQVQREDGPARQQRSKPSPAFWELVELWTESLSCIGALASDTLSRIALQAWLSPDLTLLIWWMMNATVLFIFQVHLHPFAFHGHSDRNSWEHWTRQSSWVFDALSSGNSRVKRTVVVAAFLVPVFSTSVKSEGF